jgi:hypothetical protein
MSKDININSLPKTMLEEFVEIQEKSLPDRFVLYFDSKIKKILSEVQIDANVSNGHDKVAAEDKFCTDIESVISCLLKLKRQNSESVERIPQRILIDGADYLAIPMKKLMVMI